MGKVLIIGLLLVAIAILFGYLASWLVAPPLKKTDIDSIDDLNEKASRNYEEREALKQQVETAEQTLHEIKSKTV